ncbi:MAG: gamma-glutamylcyclotransferase [Deferribacterales bacterium]
MKIFVYGTLMKGFAGHTAYLAGKEPDAEGYIHGKMYHLPEGYPAAIFRHGFRIYGEVYDADEETMHRIREYEDIYEAEPMYEEREADVYTDKGVIRAAVFFASKTFEKYAETFGIPVPSGRWNGNL